MGESKKAAEEKQLSSASAAASSAAASPPVESGRVFDYSYSDSDVQSSSEKTLTVNLDYPYDYNDIMKIFDARVATLNDWLLNMQKQKALTRKDLKPFIRPDYEISLNVADNKVGALYHYLDFEKKEASEKKSDPYKDPYDARIVFIPFNTGGHWVTIMLFVGQDSKLIGGAYINSKSAKPKKEEKPYCGALLPTSRIDQQIRRAYPDLKADINVFKHYVQADEVACGPLCIENALALMKRVYLGIELQPTWCDDKQLTELRGEQLRSIGGVSDKFYQDQLDNKPPATSDEALLAQMHFSGFSLNRDVDYIVDIIAQLEPRYQSQLCEVFLPPEGNSHSGEHSEHLMQIRKTLYCVYAKIKVEHDDQEQLFKACQLSLLDDERSADVSDDFQFFELRTKLNEARVQKECYEQFLCALYGKEHRKFEEPSAFNDPFSESFLDYHQLCALGKSLGESIVQAQLPPRNNSFNFLADAPPFSVLPGRRMSGYLHRRESGSVPLLSRKGYTEIPSGVPVDLPPLVPASPSNSDTVSKRTSRLFTTGREDGGPRRRSTQLPEAPPALVPPASNASPETNSDDGYQSPCFS